MRSALLRFVFVTLCSTNQSYYTTNSFTPNNQHAFNSIKARSLFNNSSSQSPNKNLLLPLYAKGGKGRMTSSMAEKRKKRGRKVMPKIMERPKVLDELPNPDKLDKTIASSTNGNDNNDQSIQNEEEIARSKAAALIALQKKSVEVLTHVRSRVESLPSDDIVKAINGGAYIVFDDLLGSELCSEMKKEGQTMYLDNKLELDLESGITSGEYVVSIKGGQDQYADCPRSVEYVVSLTRHLAGMLNKLDLGSKLDETASISSLRVFDRKARLSSLALLTGKENSDHGAASAPDVNKRPFSCIVNRSDSEQVDLRKITAIYFMTPDGWDTECGGGMTFQDEDGNEISVEAKNDRLLLFSSEKSLHRAEKWIGRNGIEGACSCIVTHFVRQRQ